MFQINPIKNKGVLSLLLILFSYFSFSQLTPINFEHITTKDGLSYNNVFSIGQDKFGFLWFGTENGLNRYDGYEFKLFTYDPDDSTSISNNKVWDIVKDNNGDMWFATENGLCKYDYDNENFKRYNHSPKDSTSLKYDMLRSLYIDDKNNIWIGTYGKGLDYFNQNTFIHIIYNTDSIVNNDSQFVSDIYKDSYNNLWIATDGGLNLATSKTYELNIHQKIEFKNYLSNDNIICIYEDQNKNLWFGTWKGGLYQLRSGYQNQLEFNDPKFKRFLDSSTVQNIIEDNLGNLWIATRGKGIYLYDFKKEKFLPPYQYNVDIPNSLNNNCILDLFKDAIGIIWAGTLGGGVNKYEKKKFELYQTNSNFRDITSLYVEPDSNGNKIWIGSLDQGLTRYTRKTNPFQLKLEKNYDENFIRVIHKDNYNRLWIGTDYGLCYLDLISDKIYSYSTDKLSSNEIYALFVDSSDTLWIGTFKGGLNTLDLNKPNNFIPDSAKFENPKCNDHTIRTIFEDSENQLWIGTERGGLNRYDREKNTFYHYTSNQKSTDSISDNYINCIFEDKEKNLWIGTANGLNKLPNDKKNNPIFVHYKKKDGLSNNSIRGIIEDFKGYLWISTDDGLSKLDSTGNFINYHTKDGLQGEGFADNVCAIDNSGILYFGGSNGLNIIHPDSIISNGIKPTVVITDFKIGSQSVKIGTEENKSIILPKSTLTTDKIELKYKKQSISFDLAALHFSSPENNQFTYILEGYDKNWSDTTTNRSAVYTNVKPGSYIFKVNGTNSDGEWGTEKAIYVNIKAPWYRSVIAYLAYSLASLIFIFLSINYVYNYKNKISVKRKKELENKIYRRTSELNYLNKAGQDLTRDIHLSEDDIMKLIYENASKLVKFENMHIALYYPLTNTIRFGLAVENRKKQDLGKGKWSVRRISINLKRKTEEVILSNNPILIKTLNEHEELYQKLGHKNFNRTARSWMGVPMKVGNSVLGMIAVYDIKKEYKYDEHDLEFMSSLAMQAAIALYNIRLFKESKNRINLLEIASDVTKDLGAQFSKLEIFKILINRIQDQLKCNHCSIFVLNSVKKLVPYQNNGFRKSLDKDIKFDIGKGIVGWAFKEGITVLSENVYENKHFVETNKPKKQYRSILAVPIRSGGFPVAVICVDQDEFGFFTKSDQFFLEVLAGQVGHIIDRINGLNELKGIGNKILNLEKKNKDKLLEEILIGAIKLLNASTGVIYLISENKKKEIKSYYPKGFDHPKPRLNNKNGLTRQIIALKKELLIIDISNHPDVKPELKKHFKSMIGIPLISKEEVIGVLYLNHKETKNYTDSDVSLLKTLAGQATIAIINARLMKESEKKANSLQAIYNAGRALTSSLSEDEILNNIVEQVKKITNSTGKDVHLVHVGFIKENKLEYKKWTPDNQSGIYEENTIIDLGGKEKIGIMGECYLKGKPVLVNDVEKYLNFINTDPETKSELAVPIILREKVIGVINVEHHDKNTFNKEDQKFLEHLAAQAAIALNNASLYNKIQEITKTYPSITELNTKGIDFVLNNIAEITKNVLSSDVIVIHRFNTKNKQFIWPPIIAGELYKYEFKEKVISAEDIPYKIIKHGEDYYSSDSISDELMNSKLTSKDPQKESFVEKEKIVSSAGILLIVNNNIVGVLFINYRTRYIYNSIEKQFIKQYASYIALAIQNVLHFREKEIADASKTLGDITGRFAHIMKNKFHSMSIYIDALLKKYNKNHENFFPLNESKQIILRSTNIINHLLDLSKLKNFNNEKINLTTLISEFEKEYDSICFNNKIHLNLTIKNSVKNSLLPKQINIVLSNLADNSIYYMKNGGFLNILCYKKNEKLVIEWSDTGPGINNEYREQIFELAFTTRTDSFGLGLYHSRNIIEECNGLINVDNSYDKGAKFIITLPFNK